MRYFALNGESIGLALQYGILLVLWGILFAREINDENLRSKYSFRAHRRTAPPFLERRHRNTLWGPTLPDPTLTLPRPTPPVPPPHPRNPPLRHCCILGQTITIMVFRMRPHLHLRYWTDEQTKNEEQFSSERNAPRKSHKLVSV